MSTARRYWDSFFFPETAWFDRTNAILKGFPLLKRLRQAHSHDLIVLTRDDICRGEFIPTLPSKNRPELIKDCLRIRLEPRDLTGDYFTEAEIKDAVSVADHSLRSPHKSLQEDAKSDLQPAPFP